MALSERFQEAFLFAAELHAHQVRKGSRIPYVSHLMAVASLALEHGATEEEAIAALLHDAVEDQGGQPVLEEIEARFGSHVAHIVAGCSDYISHPKPSWQDRKSAYILNMLEASPSILLVSLCDKLHNARAILMDHYQVGEMVWERFAGKKEGTLWYYRSLLHAYGKHPAPTQQVIPLIAELERVVSQLESV